MRWKQIWEKAKQNKKRTMMMSMKMIIENVCFLLLIFSFNCIETEGWGMNKKITTSTTTMRTSTMRTSTIMTKPSSSFVPNIGSSNRHVISYHQNNLKRKSSSSSSIRLQMNFLDGIQDFMSGGKLVPQSQPLPYGSPLGKVDDDGDGSNESSIFAIQERAVSFTGEDFDIYDIKNRKSFCKVRGAMLHLPGKDKMRIIDNNGGGVLATLDRKLLAMTPTYDIYRKDSNEKIGWIEKEKVSLTDTFSFHSEQNRGGFGPFQKPPAYKLEGDFFDRRFVMKNDKGEVVAKVTKDQLIEFDAFNHYQVQVASGMDAILVIACACAVDEELDEEHKKRREEEAQRKK